MRGIAPFQIFHGTVKKALPFPVFRFQQFPEQLGSSVPRTAQVFRPHRLSEKKLSENAVFWKFLLQPREIEPHRQPWISTRIFVGEHFSGGREREVPVQGLVVWVNDNQEIRYVRRVPGVIQQRLEKQEGNRELSARIQGAARRKKSAF